MLRSTRTLPRLFPSAIPAAHPARRSITYLAQASPRSSVAITSSALKRTWSPGYSACNKSFHTSLRLDETVKVPQMAESITEGTLKQWTKKVGDFVAQDEEVATIETDKIDVSVNAPKAGKIIEVFANEEDTVAVGNPLFELEPGEAPSGSESSAAPEAQSKAKEEAKEPEPAPEPTKQEAPKESKPQTEQKPEPPKSSPPPPSKESQSEQAAASDVKSLPGRREEKRVKMNRMRTRIAERLKQSQNAAASLTTFNEIDMSALMALRSKYKDQILKNHGVKLGFMSAFARAACLALQEIPAANASIEGPGAGETIVYRDYVDLSVAVATPKGLVTPVVRNAENMSFLEIEKAIADLGKKARDNKLTLEDMSGGSFTISNGGVFGSLFGTPIINLPQAAVLGMHAINDKPVVKNGQIVVAPVMVVALTYDHRLLDGREAVTFLVRIKEYIEDPAKMLLV